MRQLRRVVNYVGVQCPISKPPPDDIEYADWVKANTTPQGPTNSASSSASSAEFLTGGGRGGGGGGGGL